MRINLLGPLSQTTDQGESEPITCPARAAILLASLAFSEGWVSRSVLLERLWPEVDGRVPQARSDGNLDGYATTLRNILGEGFGRALKPNKSTHALMLVGPPRDTEGVATDIADFQRLAKSRDPDDLEAALDLVRGPVLADHDERTYPWLGSVRRQVSTDCQQVIHRLHHWPASRIEPILEAFLATPNGGLLEVIQQKAQEGEPYPASPSLVSALTQQYPDDAPTLETLAQLVEPSIPPFFDADVTLQLRDCSTAGTYELIYGVEATTSLDEFVFAITTRASVTDLLLAECPGLTDSFTCSDEDGRDAVLSALGTDASPLSAWCIESSDGVARRTNIDISLVPNEEAGQYFRRLEKSLWTDVFLLRGVLPGARNASRRIGHRVRDARMKTTDHYAFWLADRPTFVRRIVIDARGFTQPVHLHPMLGNIAHEWNWSDQLCDVAINNWVVKNQGVFLTW